MIRTHFRSYCNSNAPLSSAALPATKEVIKHVEKKGSAIAHIGIIGNEIASGEELSGNNEPLHVKYKTSTETLEGNR